MSIEDNENQFHLETLAKQAKASTDFANEEMIDNSEVRVLSKYEVLNRAEFVKRGEK